MKPIYWISLVGALVVGAGLKAVLLAGGRVQFNADEAVVALMARHILQGERPIFFYGQAYMGSLDAYLIAAGFRTIGEQVWVIRWVQGIIYLGTLVTTAMIGRAALGSWRVGILAAWLLAIPSVNLTLYTTVSLGGYGEMLLIGNGIILAGLRIAKYIRDSQSRIPGWSWLGLGFLIGLGLWTFGLTLVYSLPTIIFLSWKTLSSGFLRKSGPSLALLPLSIVFLAAGFLVGSLPWWIYAAHHGMSGLLGELSGVAIAGVEDVNQFTQLVQHTFNLLLFGGTVMAGLRPPWGIEWLALPLLPVALAFWMGVALFTLRKMYRMAHSSLPDIPLSFQWRAINPRRRTTSDLVLSRLGMMADDKPGRDIHNARSEVQDGILLLAGIGLTLVVGFIATPFGADPSGRYFLPLAVIMTLFAALAVVNLVEIKGRWAWGLVIFILGFNLWGNLEAASHFPPGLTTQFDAQTRLDHRSDPALIAFLDEQGERYGYATYWISYPLAFQSEERLIFTPHLPYHSDLRYTSRDDRYLPYSQAVGAADKVAYITGSQPYLENRIRDGLANLGVSWQERVIGDYHIFYRLSRVIRPDQLGLGRRVE